MYYLKTSSPNGSQYTATTFPLLGEIVRTCPEVEAATHRQSWYYPWLKYEKRIPGNNRICGYRIFKVFQLPLNMEICLPRCRINFNRTI